MKSDENTYREPTAGLEGCRLCEQSTSGVCPLHGKAVIVRGFDGKPLCANCGREHREHTLGMCVGVF